MTSVYGFGTPDASRFGAMPLHQAPSELPPNVISPLSRFAIHPEPGLRLSRTGKRLALAAALSLTTLAGAQTPRWQTAQAHRQQRAQSFVAERSGANATAPASALLKARAQQRALELAPRNQNLTAAWQPLGPSTVTTAAYGKVTGRITSIAVDPNDSTGNTVYVGTTGGGVWKSINAAGPLAQATFAPISDGAAVSDPSASIAPTLSIGAVAVQPLSNGVVLAGTGDPNDATDSLYGAGLLRSTNGGATWTLISYSNDGAAGTHLFNGLSTAGLAWSTTSPSLAVAAFSTSPQAAIVHATSDVTTAGLYYSTDAGQTWHMATVYDGPSLVQQPEPAGYAQPGYAATSVVWDAQRGSFYAALRGHGYYTSTDGESWQRLTTQPGAGLTTANCPATSASANCPIFRGTLAVQPATGDLYAWTVASGDLDQGLWQDLCNANSSGACSNPAPTFANRLDGGALEVGNGNTAIAQGDYNLSLAAEPASLGGTLLFAGTIDLYRCSLSSGGTSCTWRDTTNALDGCNAPAMVAPAQHALAAVAESSGGPLLYLGNDGGLWRSTDGIAETGPVCSATDASHFDNLNAAIGTGGSLAEITGFAQSPTNSDVLLAGLGQNGTAATSSASQLTSWTQLSAGEGGFPAIDPAAPDNWYAAIGAGIAVKQCVFGVNCTAADFSGSPTVGEAQVNYDNALLDAPTLLDPAQTTNLLAGTCRVWRGPGASDSGWTTSNAISAPLDGSAAPCSASSALIRSLAAGGPAYTSSNAQNSGSEVIYAGLAGTLDGGAATLGGHVFVTKAAQTASSATTWNDIAKSPVTNDTASSGVFNPGGFDISSLTVDTHDTTGATVYATVTGFGQLQSVPHVYRSTDFGAHWLDLSSNLPDAPVNALVVDPNDANTIYVATDVGVYVTQAITTCASTNCWNALGTGLPNAPVVGLQAAAALSTGDGRAGMLRAATYGRGLWQTPLLAATSTAQPAITLSATSLTFVSQPVSTISSPQIVTITNTGNAPLQVSSITVSGDFTETDTCAGQTIAVNATCTATVSFAPTASGTRNGTLTLYGNVSGGQTTVTLSGTATAAASIVLTPASLNFSATTVGQTAASQIITVANTGGTAATLQTPVLSGDFALAATTCGSTLAANTACSLSITFTPTASGTRNGTLSITDSIGTQTAVLSGTGNAPATDTVSPLSRTFGQQAVGTLSSPLQVTLTNSGDTTLTLIAASSSSSEFAVANGCGPSLAGHTTCAISVSFAPSAIGTRTATLTVSDAFRTQSIALTGTAVAPAGVSLTPTSLAFGTVGVGLSAAPQTVTLTNNGGLPLTISSVTADGDFTVAATTCGASLAPAQACTATLVFLPKAPGARTGSLIIADNASSTQQTVALTGTGIDFALTSTGPTSATLTGASGSATFPLQLSSMAGVTTTAALTCSGAPAHATCTITPSSATLGSTINVSAVVETGLATAALGHSRDAIGWQHNTEFALALMFPGLLFVRRKRVRIILPALLYALMIGISGCGTSRTIPSSTTGTGTTATPTPAGTYNLTVSATSAGITHSVPLTVTVQ